MKTFTQIYLYINTEEIDSIVIDDMIGICGEKETGNAYDGEIWHTWSFYAPVSPEAFIDEHWRALIDALNPYIDNIYKVSRKFDSCMIRLYHSSVDPNPGFHLSPEVISFVSKAGLGIDCDIYSIDYDALERKQ